MRTIIKRTISGNCKCMYCGKEQQGRKNQPYTLWHKADNEKRGHNEPVCSLECAEKLAKQLEG